jgi:hypothetical protein
MIGFIDTSLYNLSLNYNQYSATADLLTSQITRTCHPFPGNGFITQKLSLQINMKSSCNFFFNDLGMSTLQNSTQFSNSNSPVSVVLGCVLPSLAANELSLYRRGTDHAGNTALVLLRGAGHIESTSTVAWIRPHRKQLFCCIVCWLRMCCGPVYRAVA